MRSFHTSKDIDSTSRTGVSSVFACNDAFHHVANPAEVLAEFVTLSSHPWECA